jgi:MSHA biogenesis protein MshK
MAKPLRRLLELAAPYVMVLLYAWLATSAAFAERLMDPTRPPTAPDYAHESAPANPVLQSVLISPGRAEAIINGRTVKLGDQVGEAQIVKISETEVVLRNGASLQTLKLFPSIEKQLTTERQRNVR